jgi:hypothetical protein
MLTQIANYLIWPAGVIQMVAVFLFACDVFCKLGLRLKAFHKLKKMEKSFKHMALWLCIALLASILHRWCLVQCESPSPYCTVLFTIISVLLAIGIVLVEAFSPEYSAD